MTRPKSEKIPDPAALTDKERRRKETRERVAAWREKKKQERLAKNDLQYLTPRLMTDSDSLKSNGRLEREMRLTLSLLKADRRLQSIFSGMAMGAAHEPDEVSRNLVFELAGYGMKDVEIAAQFDIPVTALREMYWQELKRAPIEFNLDMAKTLHEIGKDPMHPKAFEAAKLWLQIHAGWIEMKGLKVQHTVHDVPTVLDSTKLDAEERDTLRQLLMKATDEDQVVADQ